MLRFENHGLLLAVSIYYALRYFRTKGTWAPVGIRSWETSTDVQPAGGIPSSAMLKCSFNKAVN